MARPGEMLGEERGLIARDESLETQKMLAVERRAAADRKPNAMQRHRIALADSAQITVGRPASPM
jgi:hypothetical protein